MAADPDAGMETCPSPEIGDSRKRPLDSDTENGTTKRSHFSSGKLMLLYTLHTPKQKKKQQLYRLYLLYTMRCSVSFYPCFDFFPFNLYCICTDRRNIC